MRIHSIAGVLLILAGCHAAGDSQQIGDGGIIDHSGDGGSCRSNAFGSASPSAHVLTGSVRVTRRDDGETQILTPEVELYFPEGRVAHAPVSAVLRYFYPSPGGLVIAHGTVSPNLGFGPLEVGTSVIYNSISIEQQNPSSDVVATIRANVAEYSSDVYEEAAGTGVLCVAEKSVPAGEVRLNEPVLSPAFRASWRTGVPLDTTSFPKDAALLADGVPVPGQFTVRETGFHFEMDGALPPNTDIQLKVDGLMDVIGRPISMAPQESALETTAAISDLSFASAPPDGALAVVGTDVRLSDAQLRIGGPDDAWSAEGPFFVLAALGDPGMATTAHVKARMLCTEGHSTYARLVSVSGAAVDLPLQCAETPIDMAVTVPGAGPLWLAVANYTKGPVPQSNPFGPNDVMLIDEITFD